MAEEPPFLPGVMPAALAQQRADQSTGFFLRQLHATEEFHVLLKRRDETRTSACWWRFGLGLVCSTLLVFATLYYNTIIIIELDNPADGAAVAPNYADATQQQLADLYPPPVPATQLQPEKAAESGPVLYSSPVHYTVQEAPQPPWSPALPQGIRSPMPVTPQAKFTAVSASAVSLVYKCNQLEYSHHQPLAMSTSGSEAFAPESALEAPAQEAPRASPEDATTVSGQVTMLFVAAVLLAQIATVVYLESAFIFTADAGTAACGDTEHEIQHASATNDDATEPALRSAQVEAERKHVGAATDCAVPVQQDDAKVPEELLPTLARGDEAYEWAASPLQTLPGADSVAIEHLRSPTPLAMAMLTPSEPPSAFPGFPALSSFASERSPEEAIPAETAMGSGNFMVGTKPAQPQRRGDSQTDSWGSSAVGGAVSPVTFEPPSKAEAITPALPGVVLWPLVYPDSSCASSVNQQVSAETASAIFDLSRYNEDGEEVVSAPSLAEKPVSSVTGSDDVRVLKAERDASTQAKSRLPLLHKATPHAVSHGGEAAAPPEPGMDALCSTPIWPPKSAGGVAGTSLSLQDVDADLIDEDRITSEALSLSRTLVCGDTSLVSGQQLGNPQLTGQERSGSADDGGLRKPRQEPGREYAAVAAATSVLLSGLKASSKSVLLAACAGDESKLRAAQGELHAAVAQLLDLDLAPHAYTASGGACKVLAYSAAATPVSGQSIPSFGVEGLSHDPPSTDGTSWPSIGSRVVSSAPSPAAVLTSCSGASAAVDGTDVWADGPAPLPGDIDSYLAGRRKAVVSPSAHALAGLQDTLAYAGLLINAACSQVAMLRTEQLEAVAARDTAQEAVDLWRARALAAEARLAATEAVVVDGVAAVEVVEGLQLDVDSDRGEDVWLCVEMDETASASAAADALESAPESVPNAALYDEQPSMSPDEMAPYDAADSGIFAVVDELVSFVVQTSEPQTGNGVVNKALAPVSATPGSPANVVASDTTVVARAGLYGSPASLRSGSGSCAGAGGCEAATPGGVGFASSGMGSRIGPVGPSSPTVSSFAARLEEAFGASGEFEGAESSAKGVASSSWDSSATLEGTPDSSGRRLLWRPQASFL